MENSKSLIGIQRGAYYIATKVGRYDKDPKRRFDFSAERTRRSIEESLERLKLDYIDVLQIHDIEFAPSVDHVIEETLPVLEEAVRTGKARFIGVTGYPLNTLSEFVRKAGTRVDVVLSYSRLTLFDQGLLKCKDDFKRLGVVNASVLGMGLLTSQGPQPWHPAHQTVKDACRKAADLCRVNDVDLARLALHFAFLQDDAVSHTVLSGMNTPEMLEASLKVLYGGLSKKEEEVLARIQEEIFTKMKVTHWERIEVKKLKEQIAFK